MIYGVIFALVPLHLTNIFVALICANHVTRRFGKGIMPKRYRLQVGDVAKISEKWVEERSLRVGALPRELPRTAYGHSRGLGLSRSDREVFKRPHVKRTVL